MEEIRKNQELFRNLKSLNLPIDEYAIFGSGPIGIRNLREMHDIDIIVTKKLYNKYLCNPDWKKKSICENNEYFEGLKNDQLKIEMWKDWYTGWDINELIQEAETIDSMPFIKLDYVIKWKKFWRTEKDLKDVEIIKEFQKKK